MVAEKAIKSFFAAAKINVFENTLATTIIEFIINDALNSWAQDYERSNIALYELLSPLKQSLNALARDLSRATCLMLCLKFPLADRLRVLSRLCEDAQAHLNIYY